MIIWTSVNVRALGNDGNICIGAQTLSAFGGWTSHNTTWISAFVYDSGRDCPEPVYVNANGKMGTMTSSRRFKNEIKPMAKASEAIFALQAGDFPLQEGDRSEEHPAVWFDRRGSGQGESGSA